MIASTGWMLGAACARESNRHLPWTDENASALDRARMARVCASCPVLAACGISTVITETTAGFWAGRDRTVWREESEPVQDTLPGLELAADALGVAA